MASRKQATTGEGWVRVRVRNGGQLIEMLPAVADAMVVGGTAEYAAVARPVREAAVGNRNRENAANTGKPAHVIS